MVAEPVAQQANGITDTLRLFRHAETFGADYGIRSEKIDIPIERVVDLSNQAGDPAKQASPGQVLELPLAFEC